MLPRVLPMQRLSSRSESCLLVASEPPEFLGISWNFSQTSWFYTHFSLWGPAGALLWATGGLQGLLARRSRLRLAQLLERRWPPPRGTLAGRLGTTKEVLGRPRELRITMNY